MENIGSVWYRIKSSNPLKELWLTLFKPNELFNSILAQDIRLVESIPYLILLAMFSMIGIFILPIIELYISDTIPSYITQFPLTILFLIIALLIIPFGIVAFALFLFTLFLGLTGIFYWVLRIFRISASYIDTYKVILYGFTPYLLIKSFSKSSIHRFLSIYNVPITSFIDVNPYLVWSLLLIAYGFSKAYKVKFWYSLIPVIPCILVVELFFGMVF